MYLGNHEQLHSALVKFFGHDVYTDDNEVVNPTAESQAAIAHLQVTEPGRVHIFAMGSWTEVMGVIDVPSARPGRGS